MLSRQLNSLLERWWVLMIGGSVIAMGILMSFESSFRQAKGYNDHIQSWPQGALFVGAGLAFIGVWSIPLIARWRRSLFGMQELPFHHRLTLWLGSFGPAVGTVILINILIVMMADLPPHYAFIWPPDRAMLVGVIAWSFIWAMVVTCYTRERELKRRRRNSLCEICAYGRVEAEPQCNECGHKWYQRRDKGP